jgi:hypothetical protein
MIVCNCEHCFYNHHKDKKYISFIVKDRIK